MTVFVDPPEGWRYGFPAVLRGDYTQQLRDAGYPEKDIPMALRHSRFISESLADIKAASASIDEQC